MTRGIVRALSNFWKKLESRYALGIHGYLVIQPLSPCSLGRHDKCPGAIDRVE